MNPQTLHPLSATTLLFRGETCTVDFVDRSQQDVRIWILPVRQLLDILDLFALGKEVQLIIRCVQVLEAAPDAFLTVDESWVDNLSDESHAHLVERIKQLNFSRAIATAERQIAAGQALLPIHRQIAETMMRPIRAEMASLISSLTTASPSAAPKT